MSTLRLLLTAVLLFCPATAGGQDRAAAYPGREAGLPKTEIEETFLAYLAGVIRADLPAELGHADLLDLFPEFRAQPTSAFQLLQTVARRRGDDRARLVFSFSGDLHVPVPFVVPWYHPIEINASETVVLGETRMSTVSLMADSGAPVVLSPVFEYRMEQGAGRIHFDDWIIVLSAGFLDDFSVGGAALFGYRGEWHGLIAGRNPRGRTVCWLINLKHLRLVFPLPREFQTLAGSLLGG